MSTYTLHFCIQICNQCPLNIPRMMFAFDYNLVVTAKCGVFCKNINLIGTVICFDLLIVVDFKIS